MLISLHAVITGDIVNSTKLKGETEKKLLKELHKILEPYVYEFYRGDSFQVYMKDPAKSLQVALQCRTAAISMIEDGEDAHLSDIRMSIGLGPVATPVKALGIAKGEAFLLSGRAFDELQGGERRLSVVTGKPLADIALEVMSDYIDAIFKRMTTKQAEAIYGLLRGAPQQQVAQDLDKSKSTVSQLVSTGGWPEIERLLHQYEKLIGQIK